MKVARSRFLDLAEEAFADVPEAFRRLLYNVEIDVRSRPGPEAGRWQGSRSLLGLYAGLPREDMAAVDAGPHLPARIVLYQANIESCCADEADLRRQLRLTLRHELAHHFGFSDPELKRKWPEGA